MFQATGRTIEFPGYLRAYVEGADDPDAELEDREAILPPLAEADAVECRELHPSGHTTQPPARYTEASLVKELEERGIGRPSTYAVVLDTLLRRDYVWKKGNALVPTWTAFAKLQLLERYFAHLIDYEFTATMEEALDVIARGEGEAEKWLHSFYFGNGVAGLRELCTEDHLATIDVAEVNAVPIGHDCAGPRDHRARLVERRQRRARRRQGAGSRRPRPRRAHRREGRGADREGRPADRASLGDDPETGLPVLGADGPLRSVRPARRDGRRLEGEAQARVAAVDDGPDDGHRSRRRSRSWRLPRVVGESNGEVVTAQNGRYGPYLKKGTDSRSLESESQLFTVTMAEAEALFAQPKRRGGRTKPPIAELGAHPDTVRRCASSTAGSARTSPTAPINATVPRGVEPAEIDVGARRRAAARAERARPGEEGDEEGREEDDQEDGEEGRGQEGDVRRGGLEEEAAEPATRTVRKGTSKRAVAKNAATAEPGTGSGTAPTL